MIPHSLFVNVLLFSQGRRRVGVDSLVVGDKIDDKYGNSYTQARQQNLRERYDEVVIKNEAD